MESLKKKIVFWWDLLGFVGNAKWFFMLYDLKQTLKAWNKTFNYFFKGLVTLLAIVKVKTKNKQVMGIKL